MSRTSRATRQLDNLTTLFELTDKDGGGSLSCDERELRDREFADTHGGYARLLFEGGARMSHIVSTTT